MSKRSYFNAAETGAAWHAWGKRSNLDPWWDTCDYRAAVLFWCSDLRYRVFEVRGQSYTLHEIVSPNGKRVAFGTTERGAWVLSLALIHDYLVKIRKERQCSK